MDAAEQINTDSENVYVPPDTFAAKNETSEAVTNDGVVESHRTFECKHLVEDAAPTKPARSSLPPLNLRGRDGAAIGEDNRRLQKGILKRSSVSSESVPPGGSAVQRSSKVASVTLERTDDSTHLDFSGTSYRCP